MAQWLKEERLRDMKCFILDLEFGGHAFEPLAG